jgi:transcriptional regulator GlxA family with amidase domain
LLLFVLNKWRNEMCAKRALRLQLINLAAQQDSVEEPSLHPATAQEPADPWLGQLQEMVRENLCSPHLNVDHLAELMGLSRTVLYRMVHERANMSPNQLIQEMRLLHARELLESGQYATLQQVAQAIGFRSTDYFSRLYRARFGMSPADYLKV